MLIDFRDREMETSMGYLPRCPNWDWTATFQCTGWCSNQLRHTGQGLYIFIYIFNPQCMGICNCIQSHSFLINKCPSKPQLSHAKSVLGFMYLPLHLCYIPKTLPFSNLPLEWLFFSLSWTGIHIYMSNFPNHL